MLNLYLHFFHFLPEPISALAIYDNLDIMESSHLKTTFKWLASNEKKGSCDRKQHMVCSVWVKNVERTRNNTTRKDWKGWRPIVRWNNDFFLIRVKEWNRRAGSSGDIRWYLTVFLPNSLFCEDGCRTIKLGKWQGNASEKSESRFSLEHIFETCHRLHEKHRKAYNIMRSYCRHYFWLRQKSQRYRETSCYSCRILHVWF